MNEFGNFSTSDGVPAYSDICRYACLQYREDLEDEILENLTVSTSDLNNLYLRMAREM